MAMKIFSFLFRSFLFVLLTLGQSPPVLSAETVKFESEIKERLTAPSDAVLNSHGQLLVLDAGKTVFAYDPQGKVQLSFATGRDDGPPVSPTSLSMALTPDGRIVIADTPNNHIQVFNLGGEHLFAVGSAGSLPGQFQSLSSVEVDDFGFIYAADQGNKRLQIFTPNGIFFKEISLRGGPVDVAVDRQGNIYALVPETGKIEKFSNDGKKISDITCNVNNKNQMQKSSRLQVDPWGSIYLTQPNDERIVKIDQSGNVLIAFGSEGNSRGQFLGIAGLATDDTGRVYVADSGNARLQIFKVIGPLKTPLPKIKSAPLFLDFDSTVDAEDWLSDIFSLPGKGLFSVSDKKNHIKLWNGPDITISSEGAGAGQISKASAIFVTLDSRIYVADTGNHRVQIFNYDGSLNYEFGKFGNKPGQFNAPQGISVNSKGMIFVADTLNNRVQIFNQDGIYLNELNQDESVAKDSSSQCPTLNAPKVLTVDSKDRLYVVDADTTEVKVYDENGNCLNLIGGNGKGAGQFTKIVDITIDQNDNLYVADAADGRVQIFDPAGKFLLSFGSLGTGGGYFKQLSAVAASEGKVFVADYLSPEIQVFKYSPDGLIGKTERLNTTKTAPPPPSTDNNEVLRYTMARKAAYMEATKEFTDSLGFSQEYLSRFVRIESIESLNDGQIKVTISIPKFIPREIKSFEGALQKSGGSL